MRWLFLTGRIKPWFSWIGLSGLIEFVMVKVYGKNFWLGELILLFVISIVAAFLALLWFLVWIETHGKTLAPVKSFGRVFKEYLRAVHDKICPIVKIV